MTEQTAPTGSSLLDIVGEDFEISRGVPAPLGASLARSGINFAVFSKHAASAALVLHLPG